MNGGNMVCESSGCDVKAYFAVEGIELCGWHAGEELSKLVEPLQDVDVPDFAWELWEAEVRCTG